MSRHTRQHYDPHAFLRAVARQQRLQDAEQRSRGVKIRVAVEALRTGRALDTVYHTLANCINVSMILCEQGRGAEHLGIAKAATDALLNLWRRGTSSGRWLLDGPGLHAVMRGIELHEAHLASVSAGEIAAAQEEMRRRIAAGDIPEEQKACFDR